MQSFLVAIFVDAKDMINPDTEMENPDIEDMRRGIDGDDLRFI